MKRETAKRIHAATNLGYWFEKPGWSTGNPLADIALQGFRKLPFEIHEGLKQHFYDTKKVLAVNGETVVATNGQDKVDKFMFRYPGKMSLERFQDHTAREVGIVTRYLAGIALPTGVRVKSAHVFKDPAANVLAVTQTQRKLDLGFYEPLDLTATIENGHSRQIDRTAKDLDAMLNGTAHLLADHGYYPDIGGGSGNLRQHSFNGSVALIDVMPFYENGNRLIDDNPPNVIPHLQKVIGEYEAFVGRFGG